MPPKAAAKGEAKKKAKSVPKEEDENKIPAPDRAAFDEALAKIQEVIDGYQKEQQSLGEKIKDRSGGKEEFFAKKAELRAQLDEFSHKIDGLMERKGEINKAIGDVRAGAIEDRQKLNKMKKAVGYTNEVDIDERIATIEFKLWTDTISLKEEKEYLKEIAELKKTRPNVSKVKAMESSLQNRDSGSAMKEQIGNINEEMAAYRGGKAKVQEKLSKLMEERKEQLGDLPQIIEQREALSKKIQEQIQERNQLRDDFKQKEREFNQYLREQREARQAKISEEREAQQKQWRLTQLQRKADALDSNPHLDQMTIVEQTLAFCKSLTSTKDSEVKEEKKEIAHNNPDGTQVLAKKEERGDEYYFVPTAKKKSKSKNKGKVEGSTKPIRHNAETFRLFDKLKLDAPITTDDIPAIVGKLEEMLSEYQEKTKEWETNREEMKRQILAGEIPEETKPKEDAPAAEEAVVEEEKAAEE